MIGSLHGEIKLKRENYILLDVAGVGYKVFVATPVLDKLAGGQEITLYIHHVVREDASDLYGFSKIEDLEFYELLLGISGIGPRVALSVLSAATVEEIRSAVLDDNPEVLTAISGIGKKTAERIILELRSKITVGDVRPTGIVSLDIGSHYDAFEGLKRLGYNAVEARAALKMVPQSVKDPEEKIKLALKHLGKK